MKPMKIGMILLAAALVTVAIGAVILWILGFNEGWEEAPPPFQNSSFCVDYYYRSYSFRDYLFEQRDSGLTYESIQDELSPFRYSNSFCHTITGPDSVVLYDDLEDGAVYMLTDTIFLPRDRLSYLYLYNHTWDGESGERLYFDYEENAYHSFPENFQPQEVELTVQAYVKLPPSYHSELWYRYQAYTIALSLYSKAIPIGISSAALALLLLLYLLWAAGWKKEDTQKVLHSPHHIPLAVFLGVCFLPPLGVFLLFDGLGIGPFLFLIIGSGIFIFVSALCLILGLMTISARLQRKALWKTTLTALALRLLGRLFRALPHTWQYVLAYCGFLLMNLILGIAAVDSWMQGFWAMCLMLFDLGCLALLIWYAMQQRELRRAAVAISSGNVYYKVDTARLWPGLRKQGEALNNIGLGIGRAVEARMQSERFKTDLITNVSHDLKTPLTNIVSYVDLLQKAEPGSEDAQKYMEVLDRQAVKLKKLTEDLIDASKAASGAIPVNHEVLDAGELLRQSVGEWTERLEKAELHPVLNLPEQQINIVADGRLIWRVFDNLLSNISKYSQPGTRAYIDLNPTPAGASIVFRNISREQLGIPASQLTERFMRGDSSRHTEGSGLGLSIASSLTQLMGGTLQLNSEGDLFRAMILLPMAAPAASLPKTGGEAITAP